MVRTAEQERYHTSEIITEEVERIALPYLEQQRRLGHKAVVIELGQSALSDRFTIRRIPGGESLKYGESAFDRTNKALNPSVELIRSICIRNGYKFDLLVYIPGGFLAGWKLKYDFMTGQWISADSLPEFTSIASELDYLYHRTGSHFDIFITL